MKKSIALGATLSAIFLALLCGCNHPSDSGNERMITILATNDIHGGIEPQEGPIQDASLGDLNRVGGMAFFSGAVKAIKQGLQRKYGSDAGVLVLDAGDQFQGTLISNYTEGDLVFKAMNDAGYDAAITGNHDYDFGPHGWLVDDVKYQPASAPDHDPRGVIKSLAAEANFPLLSANTYYKNSILDRNGKSVDVSSEGCIPAISGTQIDWARAQHPEFLRPYLVKNVAGVRVALIGIDTTETPTTTTPDNVTDLCFRSEFDAYKDARAQLEGQADVFVLILHDGDTDNSSAASSLAAKLYADSPSNVDVIVSAHTHYTYDKTVDGIPVIQSGHGGNAFGRIDLVYDTANHRLERDKTQAVAGVKMYYAACDKDAQSFCQVLSNADGVAYEGVTVVPDPTIQARIAAERKVIDPMATQLLGTAAVQMKYDRIGESPLADAMTDAFRQASGAEIAFMNTGGLRTDLAAGPVTYEDLFKVLPFNNHGYVVGPMTSSKLLALLNRSIETCGEYGALMQSGLKVTFMRDCTAGPVDKNAKLVHVETLAGEVILDVPNNIYPKDSRVFNVATLDFLAEGGSGYDDFIGTPLINDMGVLREVLAADLAKSPAQWSGTIDGRWQQISSMPAPTPSPSPSSSAAQAPAPAQLRVPSSGGEPRSAVPSGRA